MKKKSIGLNAIFNVLRMCLYTLFPMISYPYTTRVLGVEKLGAVNYSLSIVNYFSLIASLGISTYAIREGARVRDNKEKFSSFANTIFTLNLLTTVIAYSLLIITSLFVPKLEKYRYLMVLQGFAFIFSTLSVDWINTIYEDFGYITLRSFFVQIVTLLSLFIFVKSENDYYIYAGLTVLSNAIIAISNLIYCRRYCRLTITFHFNIFKHIKPIIVFFANSVMVSIYVNSDMTMLGWLYGDFYSGIYSAVVKVYSMVKTILVAIYSVSISRLSYYISTNKKTQYHDLLSDIASIMLLLAVPSSCGLCVLSKSIILILAGEKFIDGQYALCILSVGLFFAIFGGLITSCVTIPNGKEHINLKASIYSASVNIALNLVFIKLWVHNGAAFTTAVAEMIVMLYTMIKSLDILKNCNLGRITINFVESIFGGIIVIIIGLYVNSQRYNDILKIVITVGTSVILYACFLLICKNEFIVYAYRRLINKRGEKNE